MDRYGKTTEEQAVEHTSKGILNQVKGNLRDAWGTLTGNRRARVEGTIDRVKGRLQEEYGRTKADQAELERRMKELDDTTPIR